MPNKMLYIYSKDRILVPGRYQRHVMQGIFVHVWANSVDHAI